MTVHALDSRPGFAGFPAEAPRFFAGLAADNTKAYWTANHDAFERAVAAPLEALAAELQPRFGAVKVFRPFRDVRFSRDKRPYQEHASLAAVRPGLGTLYFQLGEREVRLAGGLRMQGAAALARFRSAVDDPDMAASFDAVLAGLAELGFVLDGQPLLTAPRGWPRDHPRIDLLRLRNLSVARTRPVGPWVERRDLLDVVVGGWNAVERLNGWYAEQGVLDAD